MQELRKALQNFRREETKGKNRPGDPVLHRIILKRILKKQGVKVRIAINWFRSFLSH